VRNTVVDQQLIEIDGAHLASWRVGDGPRLGYLHGILGNPVIPPFVRDLARDHEVIAPSLPGFDRSDPRPTDGMHDWIFLISAALDAVGLTGCPMVASGVGAMLALELAAVRPEAFEHLTLIAPLGLWDDHDPVYDVWSERTVKQPGFLLHDPDRFAELTKDPPGLGLEEAMEAEIGRYRTRRSAASLMWPVPDHGLSRRLGRVQVPVHIIWGVADRLISCAYADRFAARLPGWHGTTMIENAGHAAEWDQPALVAEAVRRGPQGSA